MDAEIIRLLEEPIDDASRDWPLKPSCCDTGLEIMLAAFLRAMPSLGAARCGLLLPQMCVNLDAKTRIVSWKMKHRSAAWNQDLCVRRSDNL